MQKSKIKNYTQSIPTKKANFLKKKKQKKPIVHRSEQYD
jgi:hypothetical protein